MLLGFAKILLITANTKISRSHRSLLTQINKMITMTPSFEDILNLYRARAAMMPIGGGSIPVYEMQRISPVQQGIVQLENLDCSQLLDGLTECLNSTVFPCFGTIGSFDIHHFWGWCGQLVVSHDANLIDNYNIRHILMDAVAGANAGIGNTQIDELCHFDKLFISRSQRTFSYITFPLLEATLRLANSSHINPDGTVSAQFRKVSGKLYQIGGYCSSIKDLLNHYYQNIDPRKQALLDKCFSSALMTANACPFDHVYKMRNSLLHGNDSNGSVGSIILTISLVILLIHFESEFSKMQESSRWVTKTFRDSSQRPQWSLYPL